MCRGASRSETRVSSRQVIWARCGVVIRTVYPYPHMLRRTGPGPWLLHLEIHSASRRARRHRARRRTAAVLPPARSGGGAMVGDTRQGVVGHVTSVRSPAMKAFVTRIRPRAIMRAKRQQASLRGESLDRGLTVGAIRSPVIATAACAESPTDARRTHRARHDDTRKSLRVSSRTQKNLMCVSYKHGGRAIINLDGEGIKAAAGRRTGKEYDLGAGAPACAAGSTCLHLL